eukprot:TRINITY_DN1580_c1_g1_i1.p1 TRINITY_DN1580_c1_g1~~TRINITY_DN1580_c1_g1_i1.p1  ORF type:complete len:427 (+),score=70.89 TRINITY_DN1580_c1_g1_i1:76-1281(+)
MASAEPSAAEAASGCGAGIPPARRRQHQQQQQPPVQSAAVTQVLRRLSQDCAVPAVPRVDHRSVSPEVWFREYVSRSHPCILTGLLGEWPAVANWSAAGLLERAGGAKVRVAATPDGWADAVRAVECGGAEAARFIRPESRTVLLRSLLQSIAAERGGGGQAGTVLYAQAQDDCFRCEAAYAPLRDDCTPSVRTWGRRAFGSECALGAENFWLGGDRTVTSLHRDHYENLYAVVRGTKFFTLLAPWDMWAAEYKDYPVGQWESRERPDGEVQWQAVPAEGTHLWTALDPDSPEGAARLDSAGVRPLQVAVAAGETLYIPAQWLHRVAQRGHPADGLTAAVNYWFDMRWGALQWHQDAIRRLSRVASSDAAAGPDGALSDDSSSGGGGSDAPDRDEEAAEPP